MTLGDKGGLFFKKKKKQKKNPFRCRPMAAPGPRGGEGQGGPFEADPASRYRAAGTGKREHLALITEQRDRALENRANLGQRYLTLPQVL